MTGATRVRNEAATPQRHPGGVSYLLRIVLPDRPGMLGAVATALGDVGGDILSLDVVERGPDGAVDDLVIALPPGGLADRLISSAQSVDGVVVESLRPYHGAPDLHGDLELVEELAAAPEQALALLVQHCPGVFRAGWAMVVEGVVEGGADDGRAVHAGAPGGSVHAVQARPGSPVTVHAVHASPGAPGVTGLVLPWLPLATARRFDPGERWVPEPWSAVGTQLAAAPVGVPRRAVLVGRPGGPRFRASEVLRLAHLAGIAATVADQPA